VWALFEFLVNAPRWIQGGVAPVTEESRPRAGPVHARGRGFVPSSVRAGRRS